MLPQRSGRFGLVLGAAALVCAVSGAAQADERDKGKSHFTIAFGGGALVPSTEMKSNTKMGLEVSSRFGWTGSSGIGFVTNLEYAPLRREAADTILDPTSIDSHMFVATAAPRFTLGHKTFRMWVAVGGGLVIERIHTETTMVTGVFTDTSVDYVGAINGSGGIDLHVFTNGGLSIAGAYTRSFNDSPYDYFSVNAGLVFTL